MEGWKIELADGIVKVNECSSKNSKVHTADKDTGRRVLQIIQEHGQWLCGQDFKGTKGDTNPRDFIVMTGSKQANAVFRQRIAQIKSEVLAMDEGVSDGSDTAFGAPDTDTGGSTGKGIGNAVVIAAAVLLTAAVALYLWKRRR